MIPITYINRNTSALTTCFTKSTRPLLTFMYAKLVIIEVGGWVELSMDDLVNRAGRSLKVTNNIKHLEKDIIRKNSGFDYDINFRPMMMRVIGLPALEKLEGKLDIAKFTKMKAELELLKKARNAVAHTYVKQFSGGATIDAPSVTLVRFNAIYDGLKEIEAQMKTLKLI